ncbi:MAG: hypothetical protein WCE45_01635 [Sedimentisphaerales bacterium]
MEIVVNEWLLNYLRPDAPESDKIKVYLFINAFVCKLDKIVIKGNSPFAKKFYTFWKQFEGDAHFHKDFSKLHQLLFRDADRTIIVYDNELNNLPNDIEKITPIDDRYLIELWYSKQERIVLTTDARLKEKLKDIPNLKIHLLEEFLRGYVT